MELAVMDFPPVPASIIVLSVIVVMVAIRENIRVCGPGLASAIDIVVSILAILFTYLVRTIMLSMISAVEPAINPGILTVLGYGFYLPMLPCVVHIIMTVVSCCLRTMVKLRHGAAFLMETMGAKSPQGYVLFSYQMDEEKGFRSGDLDECAICLMEYETKDKCALLDKCGHMFHHRCLYENLAVSTLCPLCRQSIKDSKGLHAAANEQL